MLFAVGILLCIYPWVSNAFAQKKQQEAITTSQVGVLGALDIPQIEVYLPIYEGVCEEVLQKGIGHMEHSNMPGEGLSTHSLLAGHRGLPHATLLARLGEMKEGDLFYISVEKETFAYRVCDIRVIFPNETTILDVQKEKELVSLITCTPYGINTHRLVVTGERIE